MSPHFLYRSERGQPDGEGRFVLDRYEISQARVCRLIGVDPKMSTSKLEWSHGGESS